ncbi:hypothetical protein B0H66DRAFT_634462 [Apodospora peruviana]|uniref:Uncharacterized protein n=1 Tax=Apodospora peruviana TaxID=516989 RepID=A0AAE0MEH8_9PEZI|nr:hypothetical protein B0H66DRAFT_634462 [Apodospora peruviana]
MGSKPCESGVCLLEDDDLQNLQNHSICRYSEDSENASTSRPNMLTRNCFQTLRANLFSSITILLLLYNAVFLSVRLAVDEESPSCSPLLPTFENVIKVDETTLPTLKQELRYVEKPSWEIVVPYPWNLSPSEELDEAWNDLLLPTNIRVSGSELDSVNENRTTAVKVNGGGGDDYLGVLGVYHNLHCLNMIRRKLSWDYYESRTPSNRLELTEPPHLAHCIDLIRQALLCRPNTAIFVSDYVNDPVQYTSDDIRSSANVQCVNWDSLHGWAKKRALLPGKYKYRVGPWYKSPDAKNPNDW